MISAPVAERGTPSEGTAISRCGRGRTGENAGPGPGHSAGGMSTRPGARDLGVPCRKSCIRYATRLARRVLDRPPGLCVTAPGCVNCATGRESLVAARSRARKARPVHRGRALRGPGPRTARSSRVIRESERRREACARARSAAARRAALHPATVAASGARPVTQMARGVCSRRERQEGRDRRPRHGRPRSRRRLMASRPALATNTGDREGSSSDEHGRKRSASGYHFALNSAPCPVVLAARLRPRRLADAGAGPPARRPRPMLRTGPAGRGDADAGRRPGHGVVEARHDMGPLTAAFGRGVASRGRGSRRRRLGARLARSPLALRPGGVARAVSAARAGGRRRALLRSAPGRVTR